MEPIGQSDDRKFFLATYLFHAQAKESIENGGLHFDQLIKTEAKSQSLNATQLPTQHAGILSQNERQNLKTVYVSVY